MNWDGLRRGRFGLRELAGGEVGDLAMLKLKRCPRSKGDTVLE